jgi:hypothetical protein
VVLLLLLIVIVAVVVVLVEDLGVAVVHARRVESLTARHARGPRVIPASSSLLGIDLLEAALLLWREDLLHVAVRG